MSTRRRNDRSADGQPSRRLFVLLGGGAVVIVVAIVALVVATLGSEGGGGGSVDSGSAAHSLGVEEAPVTMVEFSDFQ